MLNFYMKRVVTIKLQQIVRFKNTNLFKFLLKYNKKIIMAIFDFGRLFIAAAVFKRPYIAIAGGILGLLLGIGITAT